MNIKKESEGSQMKQFSHKASASRQSSINKLLLPAISICFLLLIVAWMAGSFTDKVTPDTLTEKQAKPNNLYTVKAHQVRLHELVSATVVAKQVTTISSRLLARIEKIHVRAGDVVEKGQLLVELEKSDLKSRLLQNKQQIVAAKAQQDEAQKILTRTTELHQQGLMSTVKLDNANAQYQTLSANYLEAVQALNEAKSKLSYAEIRSPISGRVVDRFAEPGNTAQQGETLVSIYNPSSLRIEANVREGLALTLKQAQSLQVNLPALKQRVFSQIEEIVPAANTGSRSFLIKTSTTEQSTLLPGMYAEIIIPLMNETQLLIPLTAINTVGQLAFVWVWHNDNLERRFIRVGKIQQDENKGLVQLLSGIAVGDEIINTEINHH
jgi:RND family efflux transporter MFP subunit